MRSKYLSIVLLLSLSTYSFGCTANNKQINNDQTSITESVTSEQIPLQIERFDKDVFNYIQNPTIEKQDNLKNKYGDLLEAFGSTVFNYSNVNSPIFFEKLQSYFSNSMLQQIYKDEETIFSDIKPYNEQLSKANFIISQHFEGKQLPALAMHVSGFKENIIATDTIISISADKYLGSGNKAYQDFFESYQLNEMEPQMITRDLLKAWLIYEMPKTNDRKTLLTEMINEGKVLFALEELLPDWNDKDLIGYTQDQLEWCYNNEKNSWQKTIQQKYLYSTDHLVISKYNSKGPYTPTISTDAPGGLGRWIGWQIVRSYAKNTGASLEDILSETDMQKILKVSKYNP